MIKHNMTLAYALSPGWMAPFVEGLLAGNAIARRCDGCAQTSFPPLRTCPCGSSAGTWMELAGTAEIMHRTDGQDGSFALVQFDGADTASVMRLADIAWEQRIGRIAKSDGALPSMILGPMQEGSAP